MKNSPRNKSKTATADNINNDMQHPDYLSGVIETKDSADHHNALQESGRIKRVKSHKRSDFIKNFTDVELCKQLDLEGYQIPVSSRIDHGGVIHDFDSLKPRDASNSNSSERSDSIKLESIENLSAIEQQAP